jgi:hypothetical protein
VLEEKGTPSVVERTLIAPPAAQVGPIDPVLRKQIMAASGMGSKYDAALDQESAHEMLVKRAADKTAAAEAPAAGSGGGFLDSLGSMFGTSRKRGDTLTMGQSVAREVTRTVVNRVAGQIAADVGKAVGGRTGSSIGRAIVRGALGGLLRR